MSSYRGPGLGPGCRRPSRRTKQRVTLRLPEGVRDPGSGWHRSTRRLVQDLDGAGANWTAPIRVQRTVSADMSLMSLTHDTGACNSAHDSREEGPSVRTAARKRGRVFGQQPDAVSEHPDVISAVRMRGSEETR